MCPKQLRVSHGSFIQTGTLYRPQKRCKAVSALMGKKVTQIFKAQRSPASNQGPCDWKSWIVPTWPITFKFFLCNFFLCKLKDLIRCFVNEKRE